MRKPETQFGHYKCERCGWTSPILKRVLKKTTIKETALKDGEGLKLSELFTVLNHKCPKCLETIRWIKNLEDKTK